MTIIESYVALTLLAVTVLAAVAAVGVLGAVVVRLGAEHRSRRLSRHESIPAYYLHLAH